MTNIERIRQTLNAIRESPDQPTIRLSLLDLLREIPRKTEYIDLFEQLLDLINKIEDPFVRRNTFLEFVKDTPQSGSFKTLYIAAMDALIIAADALRDNQHRINELLKVAHELPRTEEFLHLRVLAWRLALNLPDKPRYRKPSLEAIARELPKTSDISFYRRYTLLGVAKELPREGAFLELYREAILLAFDAVATLEEPYYRKYTLFHIANELRQTGDFPDLYKRSVTEAYNAAVAIRDPFAREHALVEVLRELPKTYEFSELLMDTVKQALAFFTVKNWMEDVEATDVLDFILSAEEPAMKESKKRRLSREKYSNILSDELDKLGAQLNDIRFIEALKPYTHVWIQPKRLRSSVKKVVDHLESLTNRYHGREIERPALVVETHLAGRVVGRVDGDVGKGVALTGESISIDLGATNTVVMKKKDGSQPDFVCLDSISKKLEGVYVIPTILSSETDSIGAEVTGENSIANIKQMMLEGRPKGKEFMERFLRILYKHMKRSLAIGGWLNVIPKKLADKLYITVPVGFRGYRTVIKELSERTFRGMEVELIEEPLAAAIGYEVAGDRDKLIMVIDFGGSTLNIMAVRVNRNEVHVVAKPDRAKMIGGRDIDLWVSAYLAEKSGASGVPDDLVSKAEEIKIELSKNKEVYFNWHGRDICTVSREAFEELLDRHDFYKTVDRAIFNVIRRAEKVGLGANKIEAVLLTGGSSQIPSFKEKISDIFPQLRSQNLIYDHSPFSAVGRGAALYGTKDVLDRHTGMAYAVRYATEDKDDSPYSYSIVVEKGESLPFEKTFKVRPARKLGVQNEISLELYEVPENLIERRWVMESGMEFIKQELVQTRDISLNSFKTITLPFEANLNGDVDITLKVNEEGHLLVSLGEGRGSHETGIRLQ